jgi:hypothetical protein
MEIGMRSVFASAPAANRDSDSYKQPLLASSRVMIGLMRHLDEQNPSVFEKECARENKIHTSGDGFIHQLIPPTHGTGLWAPMVAPAPNVSDP